MALVKAYWSKTRLYEGEIEVDGLDPERPQLAQIRETIGEIEDLDHYEQGDEESLILEITVVRAGDEPHSSIPAAPQHEPDFEL